MLQDIWQLFTSLWEQDQANATQLALKNLVKITILANKTPYRSVRTFMGRLLAWMEGTVGLTPPSINRTCCKFVSVKDTIPLNTEDPEPERILRETWVQNGRITNLEQVLLWHPSYLHRHQRTTHLLMQEQGPLPLPWRIYVALISVARHRCRYLVELLEDQFSSVGGDPLWLRGIQHLPEKLHKVLTVVEILAHQPWMFRPEHVTALCTGHDPWSIGELVHAMAIISTYVALCGIVYGTGVAPEFVEARSAESSSSDDFPAAEAFEKPDFSPFTYDVLDSLTTPSREEWDGSVDVAEFERAGALLATQHRLTSPGESAPADPATLDIEQRYIQSYGLAHIDYNLKDGVFHLRHYNWSEQAFALMSTFYPPAALALDDQFSHIYELTYNTYIRYTNIDTSPIRLAAWNYVHRINGMLHDDYDYRVVNELLHVSLKTFIKKVIFSPRSISFHDWKDMGIDFLPSEKVHICLIAVESFKQAQLIYGLLAIMKFRMGS